MKSTLKVIAFIFALSSAAGAQVAPAATSASGPPASAKLNYALRYSQTAAFGGSLGNWQTSNVSGTTNYANGSKRAPFAMQYAGGYTWTIQGRGYGAGLFQRMSMTQIGVWPKWRLVASDDASYLPESPNTGLFGTPGTTPNSATIYTLNTHVVRNAATVSLDNKLTASTTLTGQGVYELLRYPNGDGLDTDTYNGIGRITRRLDGRDALIGTYLYSRYGYPANDLTFESQSGLIGFRRLLSKKLTGMIAAGPMWISSSDQSTVPSKLTYALNGSVDYTSKPTMISMAYSHSTNGGSGYLLGAAWDSFTGNFSRTFGPNLNIGLTGGYDRTAGLNTNGVTNGVTGGSQATWQISRNFIAFANYTGLYQTTTSSLTAGALNNQVLHTVGFGVGYSPRSNHFKQ